MFSAVCQQQPAFFIGVLVYGGSWRLIGRVQPVVRSSQGIGCVAAVLHMV